MEAKERFVRILNDKQRKSNIAYEDLRFRPKPRLLEELASENVEKYIDSLSGETDIQERPITKENDYVYLANNSHITANQTQRIPTAGRPLKSSASLSLKILDIEPMLAYMKNLCSICEKCFKSERQITLKNIQKKVGRKQAIIL